MFAALLVAWNTMCTAVGVAYVDVTAFANLLYTDVSVLFAQAHSLILTSGSSIQNFGAAALKAWGCI